MYDSQEDRVDITRPDSTGGPLPFDLCFQLVNTTIDGDSVDPGHAEVSIDCVSVEGAVPIPRRWSLENVKVLSFQNGGYSFPSKIYFNRGEPKTCCSDHLYRKTICVLRK